MASGVAVDSEVTQTFKDLIKNRKYRCAVFRINDEMNKIHVEKTFEPAESNADPERDWKAFRKTLPESDCRYAAYDFIYEHQGVKKNRVLFLLWSPEGSKVRSKMIYASSQEGLINKLEGVQRQVQCTDPEDITYEAISKLLQAHTAGY